MVHFVVAVVVVVARYPFNRENFNEKLNFHFYPLYIRRISGEFISRAIRVAIRETHMKVYMSVISARMAPTRGASNQGLVLFSSINPRMQISVHIYCFIVCREVEIFTNIFISQRLPLDIYRPPDRTFDHRVESNVYTCTTMSLGVQYVHLKARAQHANIHTHTHRPTRPDQARPDQRHIAAFHHTTSWLVICKSYA